MAWEWHGDNISDEIFFWDNEKNKSELIFPGEYFTVFAPTDEAFKKLPPAVMENKTRLADIVKFHIVQVNDFNLKVTILDTYRTDLLKVTSSNKSAGSSVIDLKMVSMMLF